MWSKRQQESSRRPKEKSGRKESEPTWLVPDVLAFPLGNGTLTGEAPKVNHDPAGDRGRMKYARNLRRSKDTESRLFWGLDIGDSMRGAHNAA